MEPKLSHIDLMTLMELPEFRRFIYRLSLDLGHRESPMRDEGTVTAHRVGMQDAMRILFSRLEEVQPDAYVLIMKEKTNVENADSPVES